VRERGLRKLALGVFPDNDRAIAVYERAGFVREGLRRLQYRSGDVWRDELLMAWFPEDHA
jgi:RimJ/RimL family protein N-acetyltransferase